MMIRSDLNTNELTKLFRRMSALIDDTDLERSEKADLDWETDRIMEELVEYVQEQSIDYTRDEMIEFNTVSDEEQIKMITADKEIFDLIINPSKEVKAFYSFKYKL